MLTSVLPWTYQNSLIGKIAVVFKIMIYDIFQFRLILLMTTFSYDDLSKLLSETKLTKHSFTTKEVSNLENYFTTTFDSKLEVVMNSNHKVSPVANESSESTSINRMDNNTDTNKNLASSFASDNNIQCIIESTEKVHTLRGFLLVRLLFHICIKFSKHLKIGAWKTILQFLLWVQSHNGLPRELIEIDDFSDARGGNLPPSTFAERCRSNMMRHSDSSENVKKSHRTSNNSNASSDGGLWASIGGFIWAVNTGASKSDDFPKKPNTQNKYGDGNSYVAILRICLSKCRVDQLLFHSTRELSDSQLGELLKCLLDTVLNIKIKENDFEENIISNRIGKHEDRVRKFAKSMSILGRDPEGYDEDANGDHLADNNQNRYRDIAVANTIDLGGNFAVNELDAVIVLEWVSSIIFVNMRRASSMWPIVHGNKTIQEQTCFVFTYQIHRFFKVYS